jgi:predicted AAA+ superfamily ATPase
MIDRIHSTLAHVLDLFRTHPCAAIIRPRQCGKTTLARMICAEKTVFTLSERLA